MTPSSWRHPYLTQANTSKSNVLLSNSITGRYYEDVQDKKKHDWKAVLDANGKVVSDEVSP